MKSKGKSFSQFQNLGVQEEFLDLINTLNTIKKG